MTAKQQRFEIAADGAPAEVKIDPNTWLLAEVSVRQQ
jgi:hypothetical protein